MEPVTPIDNLLQQTVREKTDHYIRQAMEMFDFRHQPLPINFDLRGRSSGMYRVRGKQREIRYNPWIFACHFDECMASTVPHEVAHYVVDRLYGLGKVRPHGREWKEVMLALGAVPQVTSSFSLEGVPVRQHTRITYRCGCGEHPLGIRRHNKIVKGLASYACRRCGKVLEKSS